MTPFELDYGFYIGWKKGDFIGKATLTAMKDNPSNRKKVTIEWNREDVLKIIASAFEEGTPYKWPDFPLSNYATCTADMLCDDSGKMVGMSMFNGYSYNERCPLSLGIVDPSIQVSGKSMCFHSVV